MEVEDKESRGARKRVNYLLLGGCVMFTFLLITFVWLILLSHFHPHINYNVIASDPSILHPEIEILLYTLSWFIGLIFTLTLYYYLNLFISKHYNKEVQNLQSKMFLLITLVALAVRLTYAMNFLSLLQTLILHTILLLLTFLLFYRPSYLVKTGKEERMEKSKREKEEIEEVEREEKEVEVKRMEEKRVDEDGERER